MVNFYLANFIIKYKKEIIPCGGQEVFLIVAENLDEATNKINRCLEKIVDPPNEAVLIGDIKECIGLNIYRDYDDSLDITSIAEDRNEN